MRIALEDAGATPAEIGHLNAHGTSTQLNDTTESAALNIVCEGYDVDVPVTSTKGITGHMLGAAGAVEAIVTTLSLANDLVPPTAGFETPSEDCPVTVLKEARTDFPQKLALSNSIGFGGHNATLAIATYKN
jgi:3-oxoacyl-[acyl-carrier-protein] synthase II